MRNRPLMIVLLATAAVVTGVWLGGTQRNPWNLFVPYMLGVGVLDLTRRRTDVLLRFVLAPLVLASCAMGVSWTLGPGRTDGAALLVWAGMAAAIVVSSQARAPRHELVLK